MTRLVNPKSQRAPDLTTKPSCSLQGCTCITQGCWWGGGEKLPLLPLVDAYGVTSPAYKAALHENTSGRFFSLS